MTDFLELTVDKFTFRVASDRFYTPQGVWTLPEGDLLRVGLSDYLQASSGDVVFVTLKAAGEQIALAEPLADVETIKVDLELESPLAGTISEVNPQIEAQPELINQDPYGSGWLVLIQPSSWESDRTRLLDAQAYFAHMKAEAEQAASRAIGRE